MARDITIQSGSDVGQVVKGNTQRVSGHSIVHHTAGTCGGVEVHRSVFFSSERDGGEYSASCPGQSNPRSRGRV